MKRGHLYHDTVFGYVNGFIRRPLSRFVCDFVTNDPTNRARHLQDDSQIYRGVDFRIDNLLQDIVGCNPLIVSDIIGEGGSPTPLLIEISC